MDFGFVSCSVELKTCYEIWYSYSHIHAEFNIKLNMEIYFYQKSLKQYLVRILFNRAASINYVT